MLVIKRNGEKIAYDREKIKTAIMKANEEVDITEKATEDDIQFIVEGVESMQLDELSVEEIQDVVEFSLMELGRQELSKKYILYRYKRELVRKSNTTDKSIKELIEGNSEYWNNENSNKNAKVVTTQRDYLAGITSTDIARRFIFPEDIVEAHDKGILHQHDMDYMGQRALNNCCLVNLEDMLQNGTVINNVMIEKPHRFITACTIATQIILGVSSSQYGGTTISLAHLAPFVKDSYNSFYKKYQERGFDELQCEKFAIEDTKKEVEAGVQTFNYQVNSMTNTNGQSPFLSVFMYLGETEEYKKELAMIIEEFLKQRILGFKNEKGVYITPAFPKLLYVLEEDNIHKSSKYWYLTELSAKCTAKRMVPDYISEKIMLRDKINKKGKGDVYGCMGCRSFLTPDRLDKNYAKAKNFIEGEGKYYGRFNAGVVTLNLPHIGLSAKGNYDEFWKILEERLELAHKALKIRHDRLANVTSDVAPLLWQHGALARLDKNESLKNLMYNGYSTISLGYAGLYECVKAMTGQSHTHPQGKYFANKIMQKLNDVCSKWKEEENIDYSVYGSPIESVTYKFAKALQKQFGIISGITDRDYITNSYHIPVFEKIDAFSKLKFESEFQKLSPGGSISYVEVPNLQKNNEAVLQIIQFIYDNIMYAELNTRSDYCHKCGFEGEIEIKGEQGNYYWECPNCGNTKQERMSVTRRTCGYLGTNFWNQGRTEEIKERVLHLGDE